MEVELKGKRNPAKPKPVVAENRPGAASPPPNKRWDSGFVAVMLWAWPCPMQPAGVGNVISDGFPRS